MVSVIIPAFNVQQYIDQCLASVTEQTYRDLEIILINDGSTDDTEGRCLFWAAKDSRIHYVSKENEGLGATRNHGLSMAHGEYILFVDTDDWLENECIEKMCRLLEQEEADFCMTELYSIVGDKKYREVFNYLSDVEVSRREKEKLILYSRSSAWGKLYCKCFLDKISYKQPLCVFEDTAVYPYIVTQAKRICCVHEPLWNYRVDNEGSIMHKWKNYRKLPEAFCYGRNIMGEAGCLEEYEDILGHMALHHFALAYEKWKTNISQEDLTEHFVVPFQQYLNKYYPGWEQKFYMYHYIWGSFSLSWLVRRGMLRYSKRKSHCPFSSIISQFLGAKGRFVVKHDNIFRQQAVTYDIQGDFFEEMKSIDRTNAPRRGALFLDFMEERYAIIHTSEDVYITQSEAFVECEKPFDLAGSEVIENGSATFMELWKEACRRFAKYLQEELSGIDVILVKGRMAQWYGKHGKEKMFSEIDEIRCNNKMFENMENYFLELYPAARIIELPRELLYSDADGKYGCHSWYWNREIYDNKELALEMLPLPQ